MIEKSRGPQLGEGAEQLRRRTVTVIIENSKGEILLQLRDNKPTIPFPNEWYLLGGQIEEKDKTLEDAIRREIQEEMGISLGEIELLKEYKWDEKDEYVYHTVLDLDVSTIVLTEGQKIAYFSKREVEQMALAFHDSEIAGNFFSYRSQ